MRRIRAIRALVEATIVAGDMAASPPAAPASILVTCSEGALVAAVHQANSTSAADILASF
jgi:hypothetical protein